MTSASLFFAVFRKRVKRALFGIASLDFKMKFLDAAFIKESANTHTLKSARSLLFIRVVLFIVASGRRSR